MSETPQWAAWLMAAGTFRWRAIAHGTKAKVELLLPAVLEAYGGHGVVVLLPSDGCPNLDAAEAREVWAGKIVQPSAPCS